MTDASKSKPEETSKRKIMKALGLPLVISMFFVSALMVLLLTVVVNIHMNRYAAMVTESVGSHLKSVAQTAATLVSVEELDKYRKEEDTKGPEFAELKERLAGFSESGKESREYLELEKQLAEFSPEYTELKNRLIEFAEKHDVKWVYYLRRYDEGHFQYIVDNDFDPATIVGPTDILEIGEISRAALSGKVLASDLGTHEESWENLFAGFAPVYNADGTFYCAAGVDLDDRIILDMESYSQTMTLLQVAALSISVIFSVLSTFLYRRKAREIEAAHRRLQASEIELRQAFEEVTALKVQQDGDYFLTSLLINPLLRKEVKSGTLAVDFYIDQKKKFIFKKRSAELGGDICIAREIALRDRRYLAFTNGDAMGKSIQGAGGALVMAVLYNSYIDRTPTSSNLYMKTPEAWLAGIYEELQRVFASFDGSMLISAVLGLVDEETGAMYFFNAEHPWLIRYHNGRAIFSGNEFTMGKIGNVVSDTGIIIQAMQLQYNDVIFFGSDGRDDILVGIDSETGQRVINEDETRFLHCVEEAEGDLKRLVENVTRDGELTDDFTLIRIEWKKPPPAMPPGFESARASALKAFADAQREDIPRVTQLLSDAVQILPDAELAEKLAACYREQEKDQEAVLIYQKALESMPLDETLLYSMVNECRRLVHKIFDETRGKDNTKKDLTEYIRLALEYGERLLIVNPQHFKGMLHVADCYRMVRRFADAKKLLDRAREFAPDEENLKVLERMSERVEARYMEQASP